ncbi:MAG: GNAT family N-acetyltransferase [Beijerinckiaceae bacterium]
MKADSGLRNLHACDSAAVIALNNPDSEKTSWLEEAACVALLTVAAHARAVGKGPDGFLIAMHEASDYKNPNFAWFAARHPRFVYIDRVVVAAQARGRGLARALYEDAFAFARSRGAAVIGCEVNIDPPNPGSDAFHAALGFAEAGRALLPNGKTVRYLTRAVA